MSYFPILSAPGCYGETTLFNYPPNNFEYFDSVSQKVYLTWSDGESWLSKEIDNIPYGHHKIFTLEDLKFHINTSICSIPLLSLSTRTYPEKSFNLPSSHNPTNTPSWRATLGLVSNSGRTSYQGELDPFPLTGSLLTLGLMGQFLPSINNFLLLMNLEHSPISRSSSIDLYDSSNMSVLIASEKVVNNSINVINLDNYGYSSSSIPVLVSRTISGIPLYFSKSICGKYLSLEHTHPPASCVIHGQRWQAQRMIKNHFQPPIIL
jgi:hypothetical protein